MNEPPPPLDRIRTIAAIAEGATLLSFGLLALFGLIAAWLLLTGSPAFDGPLRDTFLVNADPQPLTGPQRWFSAAFIVAGESLSIAALWVARTLFGSYKTGKVFTLANAARLRLIGWLLALAAPLTTVIHTVGTLVLTTLWGGRQIILEVSLEKGQLIVLVFGLLFVIVGHVMYQAMRLQDENNAFV